MLAVLRGELSEGVAARRHGAPGLTISRWRELFVQAGTDASEAPLPGPNGRAGLPELRKLCGENEQLKVALAEATLQPGQPWFS